MEHIKLNDNWNANPNDPDPIIEVRGTDLYLEFYLNPFIYSHINEGQRGLLIFKDCNIYRLGSPNDHGFYLKQFRYGPDEIEWGEFYELANSDWQINFPDDKIIIGENISNSSHLKHYLFFFRDNTFECIAGGYEFKYL